MSLSILISPSFFNGLCTSVEMSFPCSVSGVQGGEGGWGGWRDECSHLHRISRGSVPRERDEHQKTAGNRAWQSLQLCGAGPRKLPLDGSVSESLVFHLKHPCLWRTALEKY